MWLSSEPPWVLRAILLLAIVVILSAERRADAVMEPLIAHVVVTAEAINLKHFASPFLQ